MMKCKNEIQKMQKKGKITLAKTLKWMYNNKKIHFEYFEPEGGVHFVS